MIRLILAVVMSVMGAIDLFAQQDKIETFPSVPYDRLIVYQNLIIFWIGIFGLIVIIRMKLKEIDRVQKMEIEKEEKDIPLLD